MAAEPRLVDTGQLLTILEEFGQSSLDSVEEQGMLALTALLEAKAVELAPVDTGNLEASTVVRVDRQGRKVVGSVEFDADYAAQAHELPDDARGPRTRRKPGNEFGLAGPKYLERTLVGFTQRLQKDVAEFLQEIWGGAAKRVRRRRRRR